MSSFSGSNNSVSFTRNAVNSSEDYFDIDNIIASDIKVPCKFDMPVYWLGFLDKTDDSEHIEVGVTMELPLWLAATLNSRKRHIVSVELPKSYRENYREIIRADANVVDLYKLGPYYYTSGMKLLQLDHPDTEPLSKSLLETFLNRFRGIMDSSMNAYKEEISTAMVKLDETERKLFSAGQAAVEEFDKWQKGTSHKLTTSTAIENQRKRKRLELEQDSVKSKSRRLE